jgi:hypothetical protein
MIGDVLRIAFGVYILAGVIRAIVEGRSIEAVFGRHALKSSMIGLGAGLIIVGSTSILDGM